MAYTRKEALTIVLLIVFSCGILGVGLHNIPPVDRDEARFAQATKQMLMSGNYLDIYFQDVPRYKKPIGIYWLQAAAVKVSGGDIHDIWAYRVPSVLGALATILLLYGVARSYWGEKVALLSAVFMATALGVVYEAHQARADAALLIAIVSAQFALMHIYVRSPARPEVWRMIFWVALAAGTMIKGVVAILFPFLTVMTLCLWDRKRVLLSRCCSWPSLAIYLLLVLPWIVYITIHSQGQFLQESLVKDFWGKAIAVQEKHGGFPGYYLAVALLFFWPGSMVLPQTLYNMWTIRSQPAIRFLYAWIVPGLLLFECVPTKLPHYILPLYPALALLCAVHILKFPESCVGGARLYDVLKNIWLCLWCMVSLAIVSSPMWLFYLGFFSFDLVYVLATCIPIVLIVMACYGVWRRSPIHALVSAFLAACLMWILLLGSVLPGIEKIWITRSILQHIEEDDRLFSIGYSEPSLVFSHRNSASFGDVAMAAESLCSNHATVALVSADNQARFLSEAQRRSCPLHPVGTVSGFHYSRGRTIDILIYRKKT